MSPEQKVELSPTEGLVAELKRLYVPTLLEPEVIHEIPPVTHGDQSMACCSNTLDGIYQDLMTVIKTEKEMYYIIDAMARIDSRGWRRPEYVDVTCFARHIPNEFPEILDFSRKQGELDVRSGQRGPFNLDLQGSETNFSIAQAYDGSIGVVNHEPAGHVEVYTKKPTDNPETHLSAGHGIWVIHPARLVDTVKSSIVQR